MRTLINAVVETSPEEGGFEGEDDVIDRSKPHEHGKKLTFYTLEESKVNPDYFDLGLQDLSVHQPRVEAAIDKPNLWKNSTWTPQTLSIKGCLNGYYDFEGSIPSAGVAPSFVPTDTEDKTYVCNFQNSGVLTFETAEKELGYLYFWAGAGELTISGTLSATPPPLMKLIKLGRGIVGKVVVVGSYLVRTYMLGSFLKVYRVLLVVRLFLLHQIT